jgi:hypothetical protein
MLIPLRGGGGSNPCEDGWEGALVRHNLSQRHRLFSGQLLRLALRRGQTDLTPRHFEDEEEERIV